MARLYRRRWGGQVIAVTGSNGKTTTKDLTHHLLALRHRAQKAPASFNNRIGVPLAIFGLERDDVFGVLEMGTNAPGEIAELAGIAEPNVAMVTNVASSHLEGLRDLSGVAAAKAELPASLDEEGVAVLNADNEWCLKMARECKARVITYGVGHFAQMRAVAIEPLAWGTRFRLNGDSVFEVPAPGHHNMMNALAAITVCREFGLSDAETAEGLMRFRLPPMRMTRVEVGGVTLINDAYNANPDSMEAALQVYSRMPVAGRRFMVCGEMLELGARSRTLHEELGRRIAVSGIHTLWVIGREGRHVAAAVRDAGNDMRVHEARAPQDAALPLLAALSPGDAVLFKGSRRVRLETLSDYLTTGLAGETAAAGSR